MGEPIRVAFDELIDPMPLAHQDAPFAKSIIDTASDFQIMPVIAQLDDRPVFDFSLLCVSWVDPDNWLWLMPLYGLHIRKGGVDPVAAVRREQHQRIFLEKRVLARGFDRLFEHR